MIEFADDSMTESQKTAALHGFAMNRDNSVHDRLVIALAALDRYERMVEDLRGEVKRSLIKADAEFQRGVQVGREAGWAEANDYPHDYI